MNLPANDLTALGLRLWESFLGRCVHRFIKMEGIDRSLVLASQVFTALIPLLILVAALAPGNPDLIAETIIAKFGLSGTSAESVELLFQIPGDAVQSGLSAASAVLLVYSGVSFTRRLQKMYRAAWGQEKTGVRGNLFATLGLFVLLAEILLLYAILSLVRNLPADWLTVLPISIVVGVVPWTSVPYLLLDRQVHWRRLLIGGVLTATAMAIYGTATTLYMSGVVEQSVSQFGLFGVAIAIIGWLLGASGIIVASAAIGAEFDQSQARWVLRLKLRRNLFDPALPVPDPEAASDTSSLTAADVLLLFRVLLTTAVMAAAVWLAALVVPGIHVSGGILTYLWVSLLLGLVNALLGALLHLTALNVTWRRLGLVALAVNGALLSVTALVSSNLDVDGFVTAVVGALVISLAITIWDLVLQTEGRSETTM